MGKTSDVQAKLLVKVVKSVKTALKKMQLDKLPADQQSQVRTLVCYYYCIIQESFNSFGKKDLDGKGIKALQEALLCIGFPKTAAKDFEDWKEYQTNSSTDPAAAEPAAAAEKGK